MVPTALFDSLVIVSVRAAGRYENLVGGARSNRKSFNGTFFASIYAKLWGGGGIAPLPPYL